MTAPPADTALGSQGARDAALIDAAIHVDDAAFFVEAPDCQALLRFLRASLADKLGDMPDTWDDPEAWTNLVPTCPGQWLARLRLYLCRAVSVVARPPEWPFLKARDILARSFRTPPADAAAPIACDQCGHWCKGAAALADVAGGPTCPA